MPPHFAGREAEQRLLRAHLAELEAGIPPAANLLLYGPRGNGKTVLLGWLRTEAERCPNIETVVVLPSGIPDPERLAEQLAPPSFWSRIAPAKVAFAGFTWKTGASGGASPIEDILAARARKKPLMLVLDEAHTLDPEVGRALFTASQEVRQNLPLLLVLAGTPNLEAQLAKMNASFWSRSRQLRIGRLDEEATAEALLRPLEAEGISVPAHLLTKMVEETHGYPYFIQLFGEAVWQRAQATELTEATFGEAYRDFDLARREYYLTRFEEFVRARLVPVGKAVAEAFREQPTLDDARLEAAIRDGLGPDASHEAEDHAAETLRHLGYVWRQRAEAAWEPGIPSLMDYVRESAPAGSVRSR